jgi:hypothetical protein
MVISNTYVPNEFFYSLKLTNLGKIKQKEWRHAAKPGLPERGLPALSQAVQAEIEEGVPFLCWNF